VKIQIEKFIDDSFPIVIYFIPSSSPGLWIIVYEEPGSVECKIINERERRELIRKLSRER